MPLEAGSSSRCKPAPTKSSGKASMKLRRAGEEGGDRLVRSGGDDEDSNGDDEGKKEEDLGTSAAVARKISRHRYSNFSFKEAVIEALGLFMVVVQSSANVIRSGFPHPKDQCVLPLKPKWSSPPSTARWCSCFF
jgi:hypothetical protein